MTDEPENTSSPEWAKNLEEKIKEIFKEDFEDDMQSWLSWRENMAKEEQDFTFGVALQGLIRGERWSRRKWKPTTWLYFNDVELIKIFSKWGCDKGWDASNCSITADDWYLHPAARFKFKGRIRQVLAAVR